MAKDYVPSNGWTIKSGGVHYRPCPPTRPVFIKGLEKKSIDILLKEKKIQEYVVPQEPEVPDPGGSDPNIPPGAPGGGE